MDVTPVEDEEAVSVKDALLADVAEGVMVGDTDTVFVGEGAEVSEVCEVDVGSLFVGEVSDIGPSVDCAVV